MKFLVGCAILVAAFGGAAWLRPITPPEWQPLPPLALAEIGTAQVGAEQGLGARLVVETPLSIDPRSTDSRSTDGHSADGHSAEPSASANMGAPEAPYGRPDPLSGTLCPAGMVWVSGRFCAMPPEFVAERRCPAELLDIGVCMDIYEYPNQAGVLPAVMLRADEAKHLCAQEGKRLCRESEWTFACRSTRDLAQCNFGQPAEIHVERLWNPSQVSREVADVDRRRPSFPTACVDGFGVYDLLGNVQEWAESEMNEYDATFKGGRYNQPSAECERSVHSAQPWIRYPHTGLRCCQDPLVALPTGD